jgi:hypothetical protein
MTLEQIAAQHAAFYEERERRRARVCRCGHQNGQHVEGCAMCRACDCLTFEEARTE